MFPKMQDTSFDVSKSAKRMERGYTPFDDLTRQQLKVTNSKTPNRKRKKSKHNKLPSEEVEIGSESKHKKKNKKYTDTSEDDVNNFEVHSDNTQKNKPNRWLNFSDIFVEPTVADEIVRKKKGKHTEVPSEEIEIGSRPKKQKKQKKNTDTSEDDVNNVEVHSTHYSDNTQKKKPNRRLNFSDIFVEPTVADEIVRKKKGKHTEVPSEEIEIGSRPKKQKKHKKNTDTSEDDVNNVEVHSDNTQKNKPNRWLNFSDIFVEPTVADEIVRKKKGKHTEVPSEEIEIGSRPKKQKKHKKNTDTSEDDVNNVEVHIRHYSDNTQKKKPNRRLNFSDIFVEPTVADEIVRKKKGNHTEEVPSEEIEIGSRPKKQKKHKKNTDTRKDDVNNVEVNSTHYSDNTQKKKPNRRLNFSDIFVKPTVADEIVRKKKGNHIKENESDSDDPYYDTLMMEMKENKPRACRVRDGLQNIMEKKPNLMLPDAKFLQDLHVLIPFDVPETHLIETRISTKPTQEEKKRFKSLKVTMSARPYTKAEDTSIKTNWEEFCRTHDVPNKPELFMSLTTKRALRPSERINFARFLGHGLEHRMLFSIYARFKVLFGTYKRGKFTPEEDAIIRDIMQNPNYAHKFSTLGTILDRSRESIKSHYKVLNSEKVTWSSKLMEDLIENLMKVMGMEVLDELKTAAIEKPHWAKLEKLMGISGVKLRLKWMEYIYPRLFAGKYNNLIEARRKLINLLYDNSTYDPKEINWKELALDFDGMSGNRLYKIFVNLINSCVPKNFKKNFKDAIDYLKNHYLVGLQTSTPRYFTTSLHYQKGELCEKRT